MEHIKFNLVDENKKFKIYKNAYYEIGIDRGSKEITVINPIEKNNKYLPNIHVNYSIVDFKFEDIKIQTTSYGTMLKDEIKEIIKSYNIAVSTVEEIEKNFICK